MNSECLKRLIKEAMNGRTYQGKSLTKYAAKSIEENRSNYPVANLLNYLKDSGLRLVMTDCLSKDKFYPISLLGVHQTIGLLMERYMIDPMMVYRKTGMYYTQPKSLSPETLKKMEESGEKYPLSLSINVLLAVCEVLWCDITIEADESSADKTDGNGRKN